MREGKVIEQIKEDRKLNNNNIVEIRFGQQKKK
jgi:hypothetical protein